MTLSFTNNDYLLPSTSYVKDAQSVLVDGNSIEEIRAEERRKFAEWLEEKGLFIRMKFCGDADYDELSAEDVLEDYEKEKTNG